MTEIKPALTAEEWDGGETAWPTIALQTTRGGPVLVSNRDLSQCIEIEESERHALAALALHEQPFGFSWADVAWLENLALYSDFLDGRRQIPNPEFAEKARALAARIAALLPPRDP